MTPIEHLLVFTDRAAAEAVADSIDRHEYARVQVIREALAGEDDAEAHEWAVYIVDERPESDERAERMRMASLASANEGWYDPDPTAST
ncbi:MAG: hypothetical protein M3Z83_08965 [Actinomycetota bacterium]|nr:hypothetical protein [Actinomycetota bacterium]